MIIAVDIGTTNVKALAFSQEGNCLASFERLNQTYSEQAGWSEQDPEAVFQNVLAALRELFLWTQKNQVSTPKCIVFSSAMHGLVVLDAEGKALTPFLLWSDTRAADTALALRQSGGVGQALYERTGVPIHPMSALVKLIWLQKNRPELCQNAAKYLGIKDYVWFRLTGKYEADISCASATGLMNLREMVWDTQALKQAGIPTTQLPELRSPSHSAMPLPGILPVEIPLVIGASDGALANLGSGAIAPGQAALTIGTSAAIRRMSEFPFLDPEMRTFCYRLDETRFIIGGASNNGTNALEWLRTSVFQTKLSAEAFANQAITVPPGADGLQFLPYLNGERAPIWDATARASFSGLTSQHTQAHFVRAVMEGVLLNVKAIALVLEESSPIEDLYISGGFSRNKLWVSMLTDIFSQKIHLDLESADASARGAFLMGKDWSEAHLLKSEDQ